MLSNETEWLSLVMIQFLGYTTGLHIEWQHCSSKFCSTRQWFLGIWCWIWNACPMHIQGLLPPCLSTSLGRARSPLHVRSSQPLFTLQSNDSCSQKVSILKFEWRKPLAVAFCVSKYKSREEAEWGSWPAVAPASHIIDLNIAENNLTIIAET